METTYVNILNPIELSQDPGDTAIIAAAQESKWAIADADRNRATQVADAKAQKEIDAAKYTPQTQPRDADGKFRRILARLKDNIGGQSGDELAAQIEKTENAAIAGNYQKAHQYGEDLVKTINNVKDGSLPQGATENLRQGAKDLSAVMAYLPLPQGDPTAKIRFSDLPPATEEMVRMMVNNVIEQLGPQKTEKYVQPLQEFMSGSQMMDSDEMSVYLNKLLRVLA